MNTYPPKRAAPRETETIMRTLSVAKASHAAGTSAIIAVVLACAVLLPLGAIRAEQPSPTDRVAVIPYILQWGEQALLDNRFGEAETRFREILDLDWNHPKAFDLLQETRRRREDTIRLWRASARNATAKGLWAEAEKFYALIARENPDDHGASAAHEDAAARARADEFTRAGLERYLLEDYQGAQLEFEQSLLLVPDDSIARAGRDRAEQKSGQSSGLDALRADAPIWTQYLEALKHFRSGDLASAERLWKAVLAKYPGNEAVRSNLEQISRRRKQVAATGEETKPE